MLLKLFLRHNKVKRLDDDTADDEVTFRPSTGSSAKNKVIFLRAFL